MGGGLGSSSSEGEDAHLLRMEDFGLFDPLLTSGGDRRHGEYHGGEALVEPQGELVNKRVVVGDTSFTGEILELSDIGLESIVEGSVGFLNRFLYQAGKFVAGGGLGVKGEEGIFEVFGEDIVGLVGFKNGGVVDLVIPCFGEGGSFVLTHLV